MYRRTRIRATAAALAIAVATLGACTSGPPEEPDVPDDGIEGTIPTSGWYCRFFNTLTVEAGAGEDVDIAREVLRKDDDEGWQCEVVVPVDGGPRTTEIYTLTIGIGDTDMADDWRERAIENDANNGEPHLGESYVWPGNVVAIVPCDAPPRSDFGTARIPYVVSVEAWTETGQEEENLPRLTSPVTYILRELDGGLRCSPSEAEDPVIGGGHPDDAYPTVTPPGVDEDEATGAPG